MNWRPIKTAPKKWERVDLWTAKGKRVTDAEWNTYKRQWESRVAGDSVDRDGGWVVVRNPTHWMPIPPPPVVKDSLTPAPPMDDGLDEPLGPAPTHWMPLPPPPTVTQSLTVPPVVKDSLTPALPMDEELDAIQAEDAYAAARAHAYSCAKAEAEAALAQLSTDDDLDEPLGPACSRDNPECESCQ